MREHRRLNGEWVQTYSNEDGVENSAEDIGLGAISKFDDGVFTVRTSGNELVLEGSYTISPNTSPPQIDWTDSVGSDAGKTFSSIYKLTETAFVFCAVDEGMARPTSFEPKKGHTIREFSRVNKNA